MQSQRHVPLPATKAKVRSQPLAGDGRPRVQLASRFFRMAFAALVNPVRSRSIPSYEEWLAELAPGSDATLETYHGLFHGKGKEPLPDPSINASGHDSITEFLKGGDRSSVAATLGDDDDYQVDPAQSRVYHEWLEGLQIQEVCRATADGLAHHLSELEGSIPPLLELDEYSSVGRLDLD
jgi:hypothetical protein